MGASAMVWIPLTGVSAYNLSRFTVLTPQGKGLSALGLLAGVVGSMTALSSMKS